MRRRIDDGLKAVRSSKTDAPDRNLNIPAGDLTDINVVGPLAAKLPDDYIAAKIMIHNPAHQIIRPRLARTKSAYINSWRATALSAARIGQSTGVSIEQNGTSVFLRVCAPASLRSGANFAGFTAIKFAARRLTLPFAPKFQPSVVPVTNIILDTCDDPSQSRALRQTDHPRMMSPDGIAKPYWQISYEQRIVWALENNLKPQSEAV